MDITTTYTANEKMCFKEVLRQILDEIEAGDTVQSAVEFYLREEENCTADDLGDYFFDEVCDKLIEYCFRKFEDIISDAINKYCEGVIKNEI